MLIVKSSERISRHFPSGKTAFFSLWEEHILFPQGEPHPFPSGKTASFSLWENHIPFPHGGTHPFPPGRTASFSLWEDHMPFPQGGCTFSSQGHFSSSTWPLGSPGKCCFLGHSQMFPQGDLLPHVVSMTTHGLANLRTTSPVLSSFLSIRLSLMSQWLLGYNRKVFLFPLLIILSQIYQANLFFIYFYFPFLAPPSHPCEEHRRPHQCRYYFHQLLENLSFHPSSGVQSSGYHPPPQGETSSFPVLNNSDLSFCPTSPNHATAFPGPHVLSWVRTNWNQHPYWAFMFSYKLSAILIITLSSSTREIMCLTCDSRFVDP